MDEFGGIEIEYGNRPAKQRIVEGKSPFASGDETAETAETDEFGGVYTPEQLSEYGTISAPPPLGKRLIEEYARPTLQGLGMASGIILGGTAGGVAGTAVAPGPGTATGAILGGVAASGFGYAIGDEIADLLSEWLGYSEPLPVLLNLKEAAENVRTGATYEMGGQSIAPAAKAVMSIPKVGPALGKVGQSISAGFDKIKGIVGPMTQKGAEQKAGQAFAAMVNNSPIIVKNAQEAAALEELIPGLKFDLAQLTGDPNVVKFIQANKATGGDLAVLQAERAASNIKAINDFIKKTKGAGTTEDVIKPLAAKEKNLVEAEAIAKFNLEKQTLAKRAKMGPMDTGAIIGKELEAGEKAARDKAGELFDAVPEQIQEASDLYEGFKKIMKPKHADEQPDKFPKILKAAIKTLKKSKQGSEVIPKNETPTAKAYRLARSGEYTPAQARGKADIFYKQSKELSKKDPQKAMDIAIEGQSWREAAEALEGAPQHKGWDKAVTGKPVKSLKDLQGLRSEILEDLRTAKDKGMPRSLRARLVQAIDLIDKKLTSGGEGGKELVKAQKYFKENVIDKYHVGSNKAVLMGEESVQDAMIAGKYFKEGPAGEQAATEFMNVLGDNVAAKAALKESINDNMLDAVISPKTKEVTEAALNRWLKTHKLALKKLGLTDDYSSLTKARQQLDIALANSKKFEKSVASSVLKADVNDVVKKAFAKGSKEQSAKDLINEVKGNDKAINGLQNAMVDEVLTKAPLEGEFGELLTSGKMADNFRKFDPALKEMFKNAPEKLKAMKQVRQAVMAIERGKDFKGTGIDRAENVITYLARRHGFSKRAVVNIAAATLQPLKRFSAKQVNTIIYRALLDPDLAYGLAYAARGVKYQKPLMLNLTRLGLIAQKKEERH